MKTMTREEVAKEAAYWQSALSDFDRSEPMSAPDMSRYQNMGAPEGTMPGAPTLPVTRQGVDMFLDEQQLISLMAAIIYAGHLEKYASPEPGIAVAEATRIRATVRELQSRTAKP